VNEHCKSRNSTPPNEDNLKEKIIRTLKVKGKFRKLNDSKKNISTFSINYRLKIIIQHVCVNCLGFRFTSMILVRTNYEGDSVKVEKWKHVDLFSLKTLFIQNE
jgi:hypothetical protein